MKRPYSNDAIELKLGLEAGVIEAREVVAWADRVIEEHEYDDDVANLSLAAGASRKEMMSLLAPLIDRGQEWQAMRRTLRRMHQALLEEPSRAHEFARYLESFWIRQGYDGPADMTFMAGIEDEFQLAEQGVYGTVNDATKSLVDALARFQEKTEPKDPPNDGPATPVDNSEASGGGRHR